MLGNLEKADSILKMMLRSSIDATKSQYNIKVLLSTISIENSYGAKSAGYSFGTDLAEKELTTKALHSNIDSFVPNLMNIELLVRILLVYGFVKKNDHLREQFVWILQFADTLHANFLIV